MDVNSIMNTYNMVSFWNNANPYGSQNLSGVPMVSNIDSSIQEDYKQSNYFGQDTNTELQDIFQQVEPTYGIPLAYDSSGNLTIPSNTTPPSNGLPLEDANIIPLIQSGEPASALSDTNILYQYNAIENGTYQSAVSSILSSNPYDMYGSINSLLNSQAQSTGVYLDSTV